MRKFNLEVTVGLFLVLGLFSLGYLSVKLGRQEFIGWGGYTLHADFTSAGGLKAGAAVVIAGVEIGRVEAITLTEHYRARVTIRVRQGVAIQEDAIAAVKTRGLIGEKYLRISPGGSERFLQAGGRIRETVPPIDIEDAIGQLIFGKV
ncbi:MAG: outer membrane lipid asymmetry maintenance protein MlaD [Candidatus Methylomirabilales bacterium]